MAKVYLAAGQRFHLYGAVMRVGGSGTVVDSHIDWQSSAEYCGDRHNEKPEFGCCMGHLVIPRETNGEIMEWEFYVRFDNDTSRLWYDDEDGH